MLIEGGFELCVGNNWRLSAKVTAARVELVLESNRRTTLRLAAEPNGELNNERRCRGPTPDSSNLPREPLAYLSCDKPEYKQK